jgi:hypothetical protein
LSPVKFPNVVLILLVVDAIVTPGVGSPFSLNGLRMDVSIDRVYGVVGMVDYPVTITLRKRLNSTKCTLHFRHLLRTKANMPSNQRQQHGITFSDDWQEKRKSRATFDSAEDPKRISSHMSIAMSFTWSDECFVYFDINVCSPIRIGCTWKYHISSGIFRTHARY